MFKKRDIVCAVEIGTSKICVLVGELAGDGQVEVIGRGEIPSGGKVVKGEICDYPGLQVLLEKAFRAADKSSGGNLAACRLMEILVTGCGIAAQQGVGSSTIRNAEGVVTENERREAMENAQVLNLAGDREILNSSETFFKVDGRRVSNPLMQRGTKLETHVHVVHGIASRLDVFRRAVADVGFEDIEMEVAFSALADDLALLTEDERSNGVLLINIGAGTTEYVVEYDCGICASGVLQIGMEHVANDISVAMNLNIDLCRSLIAEGKLARKREENKEFLEFKTGGGLRQIPLSSFETVIDWRLREIFEIIKTQLSEAAAPHNLDAGGVLTGGGALFYRTPEMFRRVFDLDCRLRIPADVGGVQTDLDDPRYSTIWGGLKIASERCRELGGERNMMDSMVDGLNRMLLGCKSTLDNIKHSLKI